MNTNEFVLFGAAAAASVASLIAVGPDRFRHVLASFLALLAGVAPWLALYHIYNNFSWLSLELWMACLFGSAPLFVVALIFRLREATGGSFGRGHCIDHGIVCRRDI